MLRGYCLIPTSRGGGPGRPSRRGWHHSLRRTYAPEYLIGRKSQVDQCIHAKTLGASSRDADHHASSQRRSTAYEKPRQSAPQAEMDSDPRGQWPYPKRLSGLQSVDQSGTWTRAERPTGTSGGRATSCSAARRPVLLPPQPRQERYQQLLEALPQSGRA